MGGEEVLLKPSVQRAWREGGAGARVFLFPGTQGRRIGSAREGWRGPRKVTKGSRRGVPGWDRDAGEAGAKGHGNGGVRLGSGGPCSPDSGNIPSWSRAAQRQEETCMAPGAWKSPGPTLHFTDALAEAQGGQAPAQVLPARQSWCPYCGPLGRGWSHDLPPPIHRTVTAGQGPGL